MNAYYSEIQQHLDSIGGKPALYSVEKDGTLRGLLFPPSQKLDEWGFDQSIAGVEVIVQNGTIIASWGF